MARKRGMVGSGKVTRPVAKTVDLDQDMRALRRAIKAVKALSPESLRLLRTKIQRLAP